MFQQTDVLRREAPADVNELSANRSEGRRGRAWGGAGRRRRPAAFAAALGSLLCLALVHGPVASAAPPAQKEPSAPAPIRLAGIFSDHMVLQRGIKVPVWGWAPPGETVTVSLAGTKARAVADPSGRFQVRVGPLPAGGPHTLTVAGGNTITVNDVLVGEVWLASGQSNMQMTVGGCLRAEEEIAAADHPTIRQFRVPVRGTFEPQADTKGTWTVCSPKTVKGYSAVGYFFARDLQQRLKVPIGILNCSLGATRVQTWTSPEVLRQFPACAARLAAARNIRDNLPQLQADYEEALAKYKAQWKAQVEKVLDARSAEALADPATDTGDWPTMPIPGNWEAGGLPGFNGAVWFHKDVDLPASWAGKDIVLHLGPIDEMDVTWFNGTRVGGLGSLEPLNVRHWSHPRRYRVGGALVKAGRNVIRIRVIDTRGNGGLWGQPGHLLRVQRAGDDEGAGIPLAGRWRYKAGASLPSAPSKPFHMNLPGVLFNGMVHPLIPYGIRGAIWYQGEANASQADLYARLFPAMIRDWRQRWGQGQWPFLFVQLANYKAAIDEPGSSTWAELRDAQRKSLSVPNTAMAVTIDIGDATDIHPKNKQDVGRRLALAARAVAYGEDELTHAGPLYRSMKIEGGKIRVAFDHTGGGLVARGGPLRRFAIAGKDRRFVWARAEIDGDSVVVWSPDVPHPVAVRYAWADNPAGCNLYNRAGLPASPFRTDDWPGMMAPAGQSP